MVHRVQVRPIDNDEGSKLLRIVRRSSGSVVTWRRAQMVLLSAQGMAVSQIAKVTFTSPDRVRDVLHNFNADGFDSLRPKYAGGRPPKFDLKQRAEIKKIALARPADHGLPFSTWSLSKLADFLVAEGVVDDIWASLGAVRAVPERPPDSVSADKAYSSRANRNLLRARGITAVIPERADQIANRQRKGSAGGRPVNYDTEQ
jgi:transposase